MPSVMRNQVGDFDILETSFSIGIGQTRKIATLDADRWAIMFSVGTNSVRVATSLATLAVAGGGFFVDLAHSPVILSYRDLAALVGSEWYAGSSVGTVTITVTTISKPR